MKKRRIKLPNRLLVFILLFFVFFLFLVSFTWRKLGTLDYFKITEVISKDPTSFDFSYLMGKNIFSIDLKKESSYISEPFSACKKIRFVRVLPNRIFIDFIKRKPLALVKLYKDFAIDEQGVLFEISDQAFDKDLPVVLGLETKIFGPKPGVKYNLKEVQTVLDLIKKIEKNKILSKYKINKLHIRDSDSISMFIDLGRELIEIKLPQDAIREKLYILQGLFAKSKNSLYNIEYIDLRFTEPVIKLK